MLWPSEYSHSLLTWAIVHSKIGHNQWSDLYGKIGIPNGNHSKKPNFRCNFYHYLHWKTSTSFVLQIRSPLIGNLRTLNWHAILQCLLHSLFLIFESIKIKYRKKLGRLSWRSALFLLTKTYHKYNICNLKVRMKKFQKLWSYILWIFLISK